MFFLRQNLFWICFFLFGFFCCWYFLFQESAKWWRWWSLVSKVFVCFNNNNKLSIERETETEKKRERERKKEKKETV